MADGKLAADRLTLEEEELELKRRKLAAEREALDAKVHSNIIRLNVGGQIFDTTQETLLSARSSFFARLLDTGEGPGHEARGAARDADGRLFLDRSPAGFQLVLEWLRGSLDVGSLDKEKKESLLGEATYYDLPRLVSLLHGGYDPSALPSDDQQIRSDAMAIRTALSKGRAGAAVDADAALISIFDADFFHDGISKLNFDAEMFGAYAHLPTVPILFQTEAARSRQAFSCGSVAGFRERLDLFAGPLFVGLDMTNLVVAGGAVLHALILGDPNHQRVRAQAEEGGADIDIFIVAEEESVARAAFDRVVGHFKARLAVDTMTHRRLVIVRSHLAVSLYAGWPQRTVQVILRRHACVADVIFGFDVDACQLAYDGDAVYATPSATRALRTGINIADPERSSAAYERRLAKVRDGHRSNPRSPDLTRCTRSIGLG